ncbi:MAG: ATP-binding cassette domain-containing protein, partial [Planctomyces sp.]
MRNEWAAEGEVSGSSGIVAGGGVRRPSAISLRDLRVNYGKFEAVKGISLEIPEGEVFGFIGPNGAGKSSTFRVLATLQPKFQGQAYVCGLD